MCKKTMLLTLAVVSAAFYALPAVASAQEIHLEPAEAFTISGSGGEWRTSGEPTLTCTNSSGTGKFDNSSTTTGSLNFDFTGCHIAVLGITASCKSEGAATSGTIADGGTFHLITISSGVSGVLLTTNTTTLVCAGMSRITTSGSVMGAITSPACGGSSKELKLSFTATGVTQNHLTYTGSTFDLLVQTGSEESQTAALVGAATNTQSNAGKLNCT